MSIKKEKNLKPVFSHAKCPKCGLEVHTSKEVEEFFGLRDMGNGTIRIQSYCKKCR